MAYGPAVVQLAGLASNTGYRGGTPQEVGISYGDPNGGIHAAIAIAAALVVRDRTGRGQEIDVSLWDACASLAVEGWMEYALNGREPERLGNRDPWMAPHECFRCSGEDEWVSIACGTDAEWQALARVIGGETLAADPRFATLASRKANEDALEAVVGAWTGARDKWDVTRELQAAGVAALPSANSKDLHDDPHLNARGFFTRLEHPEVGVRSHTGIPWILADGPNGVRSPAPCLGADTDAVLEGILGYSKDEIAALRAADALR
jgi:benzylsuccinate CoA-transferase BbsF subunit